MNNGNVGAANQLAATVMTAFKLGIVLFVAFCLLILVAIALHQTSKLVSAKPSIDTVFKTQADCEQAMGEPCSALK